MPSLCSALGCDLCHGFVVGHGLRVTAPMGTHPAGQVWGLRGQFLAKRGKQVQPACSATSRDIQGKARASCSYLVLVHIFISRDNDALLYPSLGEPPFHSLHEEKKSSHPLSQQPAPGRENSATGAEQHQHPLRNCPVGQQSSHCPRLRENCETQLPPGEGEGLGAGTKHPPAAQLLTESLQNHRTTEAGKAL